MKRVFIAILSFSLFVVNVAQAQDEERPGADVVDWDEIDRALAPLAEIRLEPPRMTTGENGERQRWLFSGDAAPWDGVLLNPPAAAFIITEYEATFQRALAALELQRLSDTNRLRLEVGRLQLRLRTDRELFQIEIEGRDREIERVRAAHQALIDESGPDFWGDFLKIGGGLLVGIAAGILVGFFVVGTGG
jgi:hypothetical protein